MFNNWSDLLPTVKKAFGALGKSNPKMVKAYMALRSEEHTSELQSRLHLVCRLLLEKKNNKPKTQKKKTKKPE